MATRPRQRSTRLLVVVFVSIALATITLDYKQGERGPLAGVGRVAVEAMAPLQGAVTGAVRPVGNFFAGLAHLPSLQSENARLKQELAAARSEVQIAAADQAKVQELLAALGLRSSFSFPSVAALVIASNPSNFEWTVTINRGAADGVALDDPVVVGRQGASEGVLVGHVVKVTAHDAVVQEIIDPTSNVGAVVSGARYPPKIGVVEGAGSDDMRMTLVPAGTPVRTGDVVKTATYNVNGETGLYPPDILIGEVSRTLPAANDVDAFIRVKPALDFSQLDVVLVLETGGSSG